MEQNKNVETSEMKSEAQAAQETSAPYNVMADVKVNQEPTPVRGFDGEGEDEFAGKTREELLDELGKTGVKSEQVTGVVMEDAITGERLPGNANDLTAITSLQDIQPENVKRHLANIIKQNITTLIPEDLTEEDAEELMNMLEQKLITLDKKEIKMMDAMQVKNFYGHEIFNQIKRFNPMNYNQLAKKLLVDFKDGIVEYQGVVDSIEEINLHMKFFQDINVDQIKDDIEKELTDGPEEFATEFHKYKRMLEKYLVYLETREDYKDVKFMATEKQVTTEKINAISDAIEFKQIFAKCESGKDKLLKDFKDTKMLNKTIFDFVGKLNNDNTMNVSFPMPKNFNVKSNIPQVLTSVWISYLEMAIIRGKFEAVKILSSHEYVEMTQLLRGEIKQQSVKEDEVVMVDKIDLKQFIDDNNIAVHEIVEARKAAIALAYVIARTFKSTVLNSQQEMKYILSYTMGILTQAMYNDGCNKLLLDLVEGVRVRLTT